MLIPRFVKERYLSITCDDGLINSALKVDQLLSPNHATFYIVTGWLKLNPIPILDTPKIIYKHGSLVDWQLLSKKGHEIGSHTVSHLRPNQPINQAEYYQSFELIKKIQPGPYSLATPYGASINIQSPYDSIRLKEKRGFLKIIIDNKLDRIDFFKIVSWDPVELKFSLSKIIRILQKIPSRRWLVLRMHGLDGEGYCPWSATSFKQFIDSALRSGYQIKTIAEMTKLFKKS